jgi:hypothetical protein
MSDTSQYPAINKAGHLVTLAAKPGEALTPELVERATGLPDAFDRVSEHLSAIHFTEEGQFTGLAESYARMSRPAAQQQPEAAPTAPTITPADRAAFAAKAAALDPNTGITPTETAKLIEVYDELAGKAGGDRAELDARFALTQAAPKGNQPMIVETLIAAAAAPELTEATIENVGTIANEIAAEVLPPQQEAAPAAPVNMYEWAAQQPAPENSREREM